MTDDNAKKAVRMLKSRPEAAALIERTLVKKWGELTGGDFSRAILAISPQIINAVYDEINEVFSDMRETANEHVNRGRWQAADKLVEVLYYRAFLAHLVNRVKDVEETAENFYQEYNKILPYLEKEMQKRPDDYLLRELDIYRNLTLPEVVALWNRKEATGQESRMLMAAIRAADIDEKAKRSLDPLRLSEADFLPLYQGNMINDFMRLTEKDFEVTETKAGGLIGTYTAPNGRKYTIDQFNELMGTLGTSTKKILDAAVLYLSDQNFHGAGKGAVNPQVKIPLVEYGEKNGLVLTVSDALNSEARAAEEKKVKTRLKNLKKMIRRDLSDLKQIRWTGEEKTGRNAGDYVDAGIISGSRIANGYIYVNFDIDAARYLCKAGVMLFPTCLFLHDNRKPNSYSIGRKIALHHSMDNNFFAGTDCTLSVMALLDSAQEIPTMQEIQDRGQRNWKDKIKGPLEAALHDNVRVGLLKKWEYRHPKTGETYTAEEAAALPWDVYSMLMVDWVMMSTAPELTARRKKLIAEKAAAEGTKKSPTKKRGRPKKATGKKEN